MTQTTANSSRKSRDELARTLEASEARFHAIVNRSADGVVVVTTEGVIRFVNPATEWLLGRTAEQLLGEAFGVPIVPGEATEIELLLHRSQPRSVEMRVVQTQWLGEPAHLATLRDVTERKRREDEAREGVRRRDEFLATLSHELRNPLAAIVHSAQVLLRAADDPASIRRIAEVICREGDLMTRLLDDLLDVTRISRGKCILQRERIDVRDVARAAAIAVEPAMQNQRIRFDVQLSNESIPVHVDPVRLQQALMNLLTNAVRYGRPGGETRLEATRDASHAIVRVVDDGIGIAAERLASIFEPFQQGEVPLDRRGVGLGIGLTLVRSLIEMHGGEVTANSEGLGCGSQFTVRLPLAVEVAEAPSLAIRPVGSSTAPPPPSELRMLVVEDNGAAREMLHALLELEGHHVATAAHAEAALELLDFQPFDVALIDIGLPDVDGFELARMIRARRSFDPMLLAALTGYGQPEDRRRALEAGFDIHLVKPLDFAKFTEILNERFAAHRPPSPPA